MLDAESGNPFSCVVQEQEIEVIVGRGTKKPQAEEDEARPGRKQKRKRSEIPENVKKNNQVWPPNSTFCCNLTASVSNGGHYYCATF